MTIAMKGSQNRKYRPRDRCRCSRGQSNACLHHGLDSTSVGCNQGKLSACRFLIYGDRNEECASSCTVADLRFSYVNLFGKSADESKLNFACCQYGRSLAWHH